MQFSATFDWLSLADNQLLSLCYVLAFVCIPSNLFFCLHNALCSLIWNFIMDPCKGGYILLLHNRVGQIEAR